MKDRSFSALSDVLIHFQRIDIPMPQTFDRPTIMMCPPDYYGIEYEINPWMSRSRQSDKELSQKQWHGLLDILETLNTDLRLQEPIEGLPDLVFTANAGLVWRNKVFLSQFRHEARQGETPLDDEWFKAQGFETVQLPEGMNFEGAGDALFCGETLFAGYLIRSDAASMQWVAAEIGCRVIPLQLVDDYFYHLDTCFCPLNDETAMYFPGAFDQYGRQVIKRLIPNLIPVEEDEAKRFACNAVVVGQCVVTNTGCEKLTKELQEYGFETRSTDLGEFLKAGGSAKCLTLRLDGEDAVIWP